MVAAGCSDAPQGPATDRVELPGAAFYPEAITFDDGGAMFATSILTGAVARVPDGGTAATELFAAGAVAPSLIGATMSSRDDVLWLCIGTFGSDAPPALIGVRVRDGGEVVRHAFPRQADGRTGGLCNEITEDDAGNVYVSDSFGARILRVPAARRLTADSAAVWATGPELAARQFGVNGIAFDGDAAILAVVSETGKLLRVAIPTGAITEVPLERPLAGPDGIRLRDDRTAIIVEQLAGRVVAVDLPSGRLRALRDGLRAPTSLGLIGDYAWVAEGQVSHLVAGTAPALPFYAYRVEL